jgi:hypothetical protein
MPGNPPSVDKRPDSSIQVTLLPQPPDHEHARIRIPHFPETIPFSVAEMGRVRTEDTEPGDHTGERSRTFDRLSSIH